MGRALCLAFTRVPWTWASSPGFLLWRDNLQDPNTETPLSLSCGQNRLPFGCMMRPREGWNLLEDTQISLVQQQHSFWTPGQGSSPSKCPDLTYQESPLPHRASQDPGTTGNGPATILMWHSCSQRSCSNIITFNPHCSPAKHQPHTLDKKWRLRDSMAYTRSHSVPTVGAGFELGSL